jgi:hypothetical protein
MSGSATNATGVNTNSIGATASTMKGGISSAAATPIANRVSKASGLVLLVSTRAMSATSFDQCHR